MIELTNNQIKVKEGKDIEESVKDSIKLTSLIVSALTYIYGIANLEKVAYFWHSINITGEAALIMSLLSVFMSGIVFYLIVFSLSKKIFANSYVEKKLNRELQKEELYEIAICLAGFKFNEKLQEKIQNIKKVKDIKSLLPSINKEIYEKKIKEQNTIINEFFK